MKEFKFKGKIETIFDGAALDAESYMIIDNKKVFFNGGLWEGPRGKLIGFDLSDDIEGHKYIGKTAEVFAQEDPDNNKVYTLKSNTKYYIKLIK